MKKYFWILTFVIILFGLVLKLYAIAGNNIFFTVDQGRDAVYAREIINYHAIFTQGPQATLKGLHTGPLWYYFAALGYVVADGNPAGAVLALTALNLIIILVLMVIIKKEVDPKIALTVGLGLTLFWPFFTTSLWAFNPFALAALAIILILFLTKNRYGLAIIPILLAFNAELAGAIALFVFYAAAGFWATLMKKLTWQKYLIYTFLFPFIGLSKILFDFIKTPRGSATIQDVHKITGTNFQQMAIEFAKMVGATTIPQNPILGFILAIIILAIFIFFIKNKNSFTRLFVYLNICLLFTSYLFFGSNHGWSAWHTAFVSPIVFIAVSLMLWQFKIFGKFLILIIFVFQVLFFTNNLKDYLRYSPNPSLLYNQEKVLDWIYTHNEGNGFNLYTYTNTFFDYSYQYLVGWYAKNKYGFYPCEYSNFPLSHKYLYIPGADHYVEPKLGCDKFRFLIIDSDTNGEKNKDWINDFRNETLLVEKTQIGGTVIEKRKVPDKIR